MSSTTPNIPDRSHSIRPGLGRRACLVVLFVLGIALLVLASSAKAADFDFGSEGNGAGQFANPHGIALSRQSGDVYLVDVTNNRIDQFTTSGALVRAFGWGVADGTAVLQACSSSCQAGIAGFGPGQLENSESITVDNDPASPSYGDVYVADRISRRVEKYTPDGEFLLMIGREVDKTTGADVCTKADLDLGDTCGAAVGGTGQGQFDWSGVPTPIATGPGGVLYVGDIASRIQEFEPDGTFIKQLTAPSGHPVAALAIDSACAQHEPALTALTTPTCEAFDPADGDLYVISEPSAGVEKLSPSGVLLETLLAARAPGQITVDAAGHLIAGEATPQGYEFTGFTPAGNEFAAFSSSLIKGIGLDSQGNRRDSEGNENGVVGGFAAEDPGGALYASNQYFRQTGGSTATLFAQVVGVDLPQVGPPRIILGSESATDLEPHTATVRALLNPAGFRTTYRFEYVTQAHFEAEGFQGAETTATRELDPRISDDPVAAALSGLAPQTTYRFRLIAESECEPEVHPGQSSCRGEGETARFTTLPAVFIRGLTTQTVAPELVILKAEISPDNGAATEYTMRYGLDSTYSAGSSHGQIKVSGNAFETVTATFEGLRPNTTYHYQLSAINSFDEEAESEDRTFTTERSAAEERQAEDCPGNGAVHGETRSTLREEDNSLSLPECRSYEQVSPTEKGGYGINGSPLLASSGERVQFSSFGTFPGIAQNFTLSYVAHRDPALGWVTRSTGPAPGPDFQVLLPFEFTAELDRSVLPTFAGRVVETNKAQSTLYLDAGAGTFVPASPPLERSSGAPFDQLPLDLPLGAANDLSDIYLVSSFRLVPPTDDPAPDGLERIYELSGVGGAEPSLRLVSEIPGGLPKCGFAGGVRDLGVAGGHAQLTNMSSADGSSLLYGAPLEVDPGPEKLCVDSSELNKRAAFVRHGEAPMVRISAPRLGTQCQVPSPCSAAPLGDAFPVALSPDAVRAWFTTRQPLVDSDADPAADTSAAANDLYLANLEPDGAVKELVQASAGEAVTGVHEEGRGADVLKVLASSSDATHMYFTAAGVLTATPNPTSGESARRGAANVYAYDTGSGVTKFVADLCTGPETSGSTLDSACPQTVAPENGGTNRASDADCTAPNHPCPAQSTPDGRYLLFRTFARLTSDDTDTAADVYRFDLRSGELTRVSIGRRGNDGDGNDDAYGAEFAFEFSGEGFAKALADAAGDRIRSISSDGSTVIFQTPAPLVSADTDTGDEPFCGANSDATPNPSGCDVYEWRQEGTGGCEESAGCVSLVSGGRDPQGSEAARISPSGRDIIFKTSAALLPADNDGVVDIYDARIDGGFARTTVPPICDRAESCHGVAAPLATAPPISSGGETAGNGPAQLRCAKGKRRVRRHGRLRCVRVRSRKHHKHHPKHPKHNRRSHPKGAGADRGGSR